MSGATPPDDSVVEFAYPGGIEALRITETPEWLESLRDTGVSESETGGVAPLTTGYWL